MFMRYSSALLLVFAFAAQQQGSVPTLTPGGVREFSEPFSEIGGIVELRDGRLLVHDVQEKEIRLVDMTRGAMTRVGRTGAGPLEFNPLGILLSGASDSAIYFDAIQRRFLIFAPNGAPARTTSALVSSDPRQMLRDAVPIAVDASGRIYGQSLGMAVPTSAASTSPDFLDSVHVVRSDVRSGRSDTIARLRAPLAQAKPQMKMTGSAIKMIMTAPSFRANDVWTALPDGRVAILRNGEYRVYFANAGGAETSGPPVPHTLVPLTTAMRREAMDSARSAMKANLDKTNRKMSELQATMGGGSATEIPSIQMEVVEPATWASHLPPYEAIRSFSDGKLLVSVGKSAGAAEASYDLLDNTGKLLAHMRFSSRERIVGLGNGTIYTVRTDADDLLHLRKYTVPVVR